MTQDRVGAWIDALIDRHCADMTRPELLKAIRALSSRYVERRADLPERSPLDSAGKRAAFATFYSPLHFITAGLVVRALGDDATPRGRMLDLGCGTGVASAAWALASEPGRSDRPRRSPVIAGIDRYNWALGEARWNWRALGLTGRATHDDLVQALTSTVQRAGHSGASPSSLGVMLGWSANELDAAARAKTLPALIALADAGAVVIVIEPIARRAAPWWNDWAAVVVEAGGRADEWTFDDALPPTLARLDADAGFDRRQLKARSLRLGPARVA